MARHPKGGYAVLLDTATWDPADGRPGSADAAASALRNAGWTVAVAVAGSDPRPGLGRAVKRRAVAIGGRSGRRHVARERATRRDHPGLDVARRRGARRGLVVVALGLALHRLGPLAVVAGQCLGPARAARRPLRGHAAARAHGVRPLRRVGRGGGHADRHRHRAGAAPRPRSSSWSPSRSGRSLVAVYGAAVLGGAPAAAGVPLLAVFAVPAALDDSLLPWQAVVFAAAGFGVLLVLRDGARRQRLGGVVLVAVAVVVGVGGRRSGHVRRHRGPLRRRRGGRERRDRPQPVHHAARAAHAGAAHRAVRGARAPPARLPACADVEHVRAGRRLAGHPSGPRPEPAGHARRGRGRGGADRHRRRPERGLQGLLAPALRAADLGGGAVRSLDLRRAHRHGLHRAAPRRRRLAADGRLLRAHRGPAPRRAGQHRSRGGLPRHLRGSTAG